MSAIQRLQERMAKEGTNQKMADNIIFCIFLNDLMGFTCYTSGDFKRCINVNMFVKNGDWELSMVNVADGTLRCTYEAVNVRDYI